MTRTARFLVAFLLAASASGQSISVRLPSGGSAQAHLYVYTTFQRADGHTVELPMDRGEGPSWRRAPGNLFSTPKVVRIDPSADRARPGGPFDHAAARHRLD